jgi:acetyltransferase-like isoleucine patch superfamily enzyme
MAADAVWRKTDGRDVRDHLNSLLRQLQQEVMQRWKRRVPVGDLLTDRWENARLYGFGDGTSMYDSALVIGDVKVGRDTWIGPNVVLDGSGGLVIGDYCSISAGVGIYTHHTVKWATSMGQESIEHAPVKIGSGVYIGPNSIIQKGVTIGDRAVIGAMSFVNCDVPPGAKVYGIPANG